MNTLTTPTNHGQPAAEMPDASVLSLQQACLLLLGSVMLLPAYAAHSNNSDSGVRSSPIILAQVNPRGDPIMGGPTQGDGIYAIPASPPPPRPLPPPAAPVAAPPIAPPAAPAPVKPPVKPVTPGPHANPSPGSAPDLPPTQAAGSVNSAALVNLVSPPSANASVGSIPVGGTLGPVGTPPSGNQLTVLLPVDDPVRPPSGSGPALFPSIANLPPPANSANSIKPPVKPVPSLGFGKVFGSVGGLGEILPGAQKLGESMQEQTASAKATDTSAVASGAQAKCTAVSLRPDARRPSVSLVDLLGDGLIVAAVPDTHIQSVFARAGYGSVDLSKAARWCVTPNAARELLQPVRGTGVQDAALLVQTGGGLQLMSQDQWLAHQASLKPLVAAMTPVKPAKAVKLTKAASRTLAKPTAKSSTGITVGALRLPAGASKAAGTAS
jgi:hypothetical protein